MCINYDIFLSNYISELRSQAFSVLRADILVSLGEDYHLNLRSPSTVDQLTLTITGRPVSTSEEVFTDINCKYGISKETYDVITKYSANVDGCQPTDAYFSAQLSDGKSHGGSYVGFNHTLNKYANETGTMLWLNEDAMERDGVRLVGLYFLIFLSEKPLFDIIPFYAFGWDANLTQSAHSD